MLGARDAAHPWLFDLGVAIWGSAFILAGLALALEAKRGWLGLLGPGLIAFTGVAQILDGFPFPADCRWTIDAGCRARETAGELSWQHYAHGVTYLFGGVALQLSVFAMAWRFHSDERWGRFDLLALLGGLLGLVIIGGPFLIADNEPGGHYGLIQRFALAAGASGYWHCRSACSSSGHLRGGDDRGGGAYPRDGRDPLARAGDLTTPSLAVSRLTAPTRSPGLPSVGVLRKARQAKGRKRCSFV